MTRNEEFNEKDRFNPYYIHLSETIYGKNFQSPGGNEFLGTMLSSLKSRTTYSSALDVGFGCGGNSIFLNRRFNCSVTAIDINDAFFNIAPQRIREAGASSIVLLKKSILELDEVDKFDLVLCRDVLMYIEEKENALENIYNSMVPGGVLIVIDYCRKNADLSDEFNDHVRRGNFYLSTLMEYKHLMESADFCNVRLRDITSQYISYMEQALVQFDNGNELSRIFYQKDLDYIRKRTIDKIGYCNEGSMVWGAIIAEKP